MRALRIRPIACALFIALASFPTVAQANHTACNGQSNEVGTTNPCPEFTPNWRANVASYNTHGSLQPNPVVFAPTTVQFEFAGTDHESPVVEVSHYLPKGWNFSFGQLQAESPARKADLSLATSCNDIYDTNNPRRVARAEIISASPRMNMRTGTGTRASVTYEAVGAARSNVSFLRWDEASGVADLCLQYVSSSAVGTPPANDLVLPMTATRLSDPELGWRLTIDQSPIWRHPTLRNVNASVVMQSVHINSISAGNWHRNPLTNAFEKIVVSRAPSSGVNGRFRGVLTGCRTGFDPITSPTLCRDGRTITVEHEDIIPITPAPKGQPLPIAALTGPTGFGSGTGTALTTTAQYQGFGLVKGTDTATISWTQPSMPLDSYVKGYVVVVAKPNGQDSRVFRRVISDPAAAGFNPASPPCGADGKAPTCSLQLKFPLVGVGGDTMQGDFVNSGDTGTYDVALITMYGKIYQEGTWLDDGRRSDGLCDDGTGQGALCDPTVAPPVLNAPGKSYWRFMMRRAVWPQVFTERGYAPTPEGFKRACTCMPHMILLLDVPNKRAEFTVWEQQTPDNKIGESTGPVAPGTWYGASNGIAGDPNQAASIVWGGINDQFGFWGYLQGATVRARVLFNVRVDMHSGRGQIIEFQGSRV